VPTLILNALDDPFVRITDESRAKIKANPNITLKESKHGGHCAFLAQPDESSGYDGYWAEHTLLRFLLSHV
jgi:predicted alpha/beta-fold hydrolase